MSLLTRGIAALLATTGTFNLLPNQTLNNNTSQQANEPSSLVSTELPPSRQQLQTEEPELILLLNKLRLTTQTPTTDEIFNALNKFAEEKQGIESEVSIKDIISSIKTNTEKHFEDSKEKPGITNYVPGLTSKDYKKLDYIYNIQKQIENELTKQLSSKFENTSPHIKGKLKGKFKSLTFVSKYSKTDEDLNKIGYYEPIHNTLVIYPDNIQELCLNENIPFEEALEIFIANFINYLEQTIYTQSSEIEPVTISCTKKSETPAIETNENKEISLLLLLNKSNKNIDYNELKKIVLERDIPKLYQILGATNINDILIINQVIFTISNNYSNQSLLKDFIIMPSTNKNLGLVYLFQAGFENILATINTNKELKYEEVSLIYDVLKNLIAQKLFGATETDLKEIVPKLIELDEYFTNELMKHFNIPEDKRIKPQATEFINFVNFCFDKIKNSELSPEEQSKITTLANAFPSLATVISNQPYTTPYDWEMLLNNWKEAIIQTTPLYTYTYSEDTLQDQTDYTIDPTIKYDLHISKRNTKN